MRRFLVGLWACGCTQATTPTEPTPKVPVAEVARPAPPNADEANAPWSEPIRSHIVLVNHESTDKTASFVGVDVAHDKVLAIREVGAAPIERWPQHTRAVAGHGGGPTFLTQRSAGDAWELVRIGLDDGREVRVPISAQADAIHVVGEQALVGIKSTVGAVDFRTKVPSLEPLHQRELASGKAYDLFVRSGDLVVAIDDVVRPIFADTFRIATDRGPAHVVGFELPGMINGTYYAGALQRSGPASGVLFVLANYGIMDGNGHDLAALPLEGGKTKHGGDVILNSTRSTDPAVLEEHVSRQTGKPEKLAAGTTFTDWPSVELVGERSGQVLLLPAQARGLLAVPVGFAPDTKAEVVFSGAAADVKVDGSRVFVLSGSELVELSWATPRPREVRRTRLPAAFTRIVD